MMDWANTLGTWLGIGLMIAIPMWAYYHNWAKVEVEKEKTKQLELHSKLKETKPCVGAIS